MFLTSQLAEIAQRFQPDVEDLQVLLQEEGLPVGSAKCVEELAARLNADLRLRHDVAFLVCAMLGRGRSQAGESGSMDVLGVLVVAAAGTRQEFETPDRQQAMRELLRFVIQQRRLGVAPTVVREERPVPVPVVVPPQVEIREEAVAAEPPATRDAVVLPPLFRAEEEVESRRPHLGRIAALLALVIGLGAGVVIWHEESEPETQAVVSAPAAVPAYPAVAPERRVIVPRRAPASRVARKARTAVAPALRRRAATEEPSVAAPTRAAVPAESVRNAVRTTQPAIAAVQPSRTSGQASSVPASVARPPVAAGLAAGSNPFAHPEAAAAAAEADSGGPMPEFHAKDPVLIARNKPPTALGQATQPGLQGTVHAGETGNMASNLMYSPDPEYPAEAIASRVTGEVTVRVVVGPDGNVIDARVVSGPPLLREAALDAVGRWRYRPYEQGGKPVPIATTAIFDFQLPTS